MFDLVQIAPTHTAYPDGLRQFLSEKSLPTLSAIGNLEILQSPAIALFCSTQCSDDLVHLTYDFIKRLRDTQVTVVSGFHSPVEKVCLKLLLQGTQPLIHCPARSLHNLRFSPDQKTAIEAKRLLLLSPFPVSQRRATAALAERRNRLVGAITTGVFIAYATPGGKTEKLARAIAAQNKPLFTLNSPGTQNLQQAGAAAIDAGSKISMLVGDRE
ncbi:MAG: DNA-processing protein DprA [Cyanobacteria bacterium J06626_18]